MVVQDTPQQMEGAKAPPKVERKHRLKQRFEVVKKLGQGTYGKVQLAINKETGQEVAIKTIKKAKIESEQDLVRIRREIQIMSSIQHPHIIHIYEVFENREKIVLVMQYASGGELYEYVSEKKLLCDIEARRLFRQIAAAVYYCHKNKICHRDLKLENILIDEKGNAKIADFGLSNVFDERHLLSTFCGSPLYASPEIVKGSPYYGPEVDCWSMGVLLYTLVYGAMPFDGSNFKRLVRQISEGDYYEPKKKSDASGLIRRLLTVNPVKRATIIDICTEWWVNVGYEHSLLQVAEDMANLTPVRLDLLLALAPVSPPPQEVQDSPLSQVQPNKRKESLPQEEPDVCYPAEDIVEDAGDEVSNSFAYVQEFEGSNTNLPNEDAYYQENEGSEEEFLPASLAAELDGRSAKRPAEKSFDGSMMRISSLAHKSKKPKKSESIQNAKIPKELTKEKLANLTQQKSQSKLTKQKAVPPPQEAKPNIPVAEKTASTEVVNKINKKTEKPTPVEISGEEQNLPSPKQQEPEAANKNDQVALKMQNGSQEMSPSIEMQTSKPDVVETETKKDEIQEPAQQVTDVTDAKSVEAAQMPETSELPPTPPEDKQMKSKRSASLGGRRPGKITIPKFLESTSASSTPTDKKTVVKLSRAVSDAKKMFEGKNQNDKRVVIIPSLKVADARKAFEQSIADSNNSPVHILRKGSSPAVLVSSNMQENSPSVPKSQEVSSGEPSAVETSLNATSSEKPTDRKESKEAKQDAKTLQDKSEELSATPDVKSSQTNSSEVKDKADQSAKNESVDDEQRKNAAKGILKKTLARARLAEKRLSQQSSQESESGSVTPPTPSIGTSPATPSSEKPSTPSFFRTPRPFVKEQQTSKVQSKAEIVLNKKSEEISQPPKVKAQISNDAEVVPEGESIWGPEPPVPATPPVNVHTTHTAMVDSYDQHDYSNSESESNWKHTVEESLRRLSPEGASEDQNFQQMSPESIDGNSGPVPIARSYKKFTFTRDGACITETGEIYTTPSSDGTWTKVEKKTKVTRHPSQGDDSNESPRIRKTPPLGRSDSQSSSGSNDIFEDMFDTWTGDSVLGNLVNVKTVFNRLSKDPFFRRGRKKDKHRKAREMRGEWVASSAHSTDRESSDNDDDLECLFEDSRPVMYGSQGLWQFLRSINRDLPSHLRTIRSTSRQFSQERDNLSRPPTRSTVGSGTRSVSRDRVNQSPRQTVLRFVIESPGHQRLVNASEPTTPASYQREKGWSGTEQEYPRKDSGVESWASWEPEHSSRHSFSSHRSKGDEAAERAAFYGTIRPKMYQRYTKSLSRDGPESVTSGVTTLHETEGSNRSDLSRGVNTSENRKRRVEQWLHMTDSDEHPIKIDPKGHGVSDSDRMSLYGTIRPRGHMKYNRSASEKLVGMDLPPDLDDDHRSQSIQDLHNSENGGTKAQSMYRTTSEIQVNSSTDSLNQNYANESRLHRGSFGSSNLHPVHEGISGIHIEPCTTKRQGRPVLQMRVSFNKNRSEPEVVVMSPKKVVNSPNEQQCSTSSPSVSDMRPSFSHVDHSLLDALRTHGYRGVISQRFGSERTAMPTFASPGRNEGSAQCDVESELQIPAAEIILQQQQQPVAAEINERGKVEPNASSSNVDTESNACSKLCMATNQTSNSCVKSNSNNGNIGSEKTDLEIKGQCVSSEEQSSVDRGSAPSDEAATPEEGSIHGEAEAMQPRESRPPRGVDIGGESVSERIHRKSFYTRFNDSRPRRRRSSYFDDVLPDVRPVHISTSSWSVNNEDDSDRDSSSVSRRNSLRKRSLQNLANGNELYSRSYSTRSTSYLDDLMDNNASSSRTSMAKSEWLQKPESRSSQLYDELASSDDIGGTYRSLRRSSFKAIDPHVRHAASSAFKDTSNVSTIRLPNHRLSYSQPSSFDHDYSDPNERQSYSSVTRVPLPYVIDHPRFVTRSQQDPVSPLDEPYQTSRRGSRFSMLGDYSDLEDYDFPHTGHVSNTGGMEDYTDMDEVLRRSINITVPLQRKE